MRQSCDLVLTFNLSQWKNFGTHPEFCSTSFTHSYNINWRLFHIIKLWQQSTSFFSISLSPFPAISMFDHCNSKVKRDRRRYFPKVVCFTPSWMCWIKKKVKHGREKFHFVSVHELPSKRRGRGENSFFFPFENDGNNLLLLLLLLLPACFRNAFLETVSMDRFKFDLPVGCYWRMEDNSRFNLTLIFTDSFSWKWQGNCFSFSPSFSSTLFNLTSINFYYWHEVTRSDREDGWKRMWASEWMEEFIDDDRHRIGHRERFLLQVAIHLLEGFPFFSSHTSRGYNFVVDQ